MSGKGQEKESPVRSEGNALEGGESTEATENPSNEPAAQADQSLERPESPNETPESPQAPSGPEESQRREGAAESGQGPGDMTGVEERSSGESLEGESTNEPLRDEPEGEVGETIGESAVPEEEVRPLCHDEVRGAIEAVLYAASEPLSPRDLRKILPEVGTEEIKQCLQELIELYNGEGRGLQIVEVAGGYQITTRPEYHERVSTLFHFKPPSKISIQALETLATIAYRQPITVPEIQELRGVRSTSVIRTLLEKKLIRIMGRKAVVGRPLLYGTTKEFLLRFGLKDLGELPRLEDMAEVFGEDMALQLEEFGGAAGPSPTDGGDEYPGGIIASEQPTSASNGDEIPSKTETEKSEELPFDNDADSTDGRGHE